MQESHKQDTCNMYPHVSGEFKPVESHASESSLFDLEGLTAKSGAMKQEWDKMVIYNYL